MTPNTFQKLENLPWSSRKNNVRVTWFKMVALDPVFLRANLTPQENAGFRANSAIFISFFPLFIMDTIQGRD